MAPTQPQFDLKDLALPAGLAVCAIFLFIAILVLTDKAKGKKSKTVKALGKPEVDVATVFVKEGDNVVRRSTRYAKSQWRHHALSPLFNLVWKNTCLTGSGRFFSRRVRKGTTPAKEEVITSIDRFHRQHAC